MHIKEILSSENTTPLSTKKLASLETGSAVEKALYQAHKTQDFEGFYTALKTHLGVTVIADVVKEFVESSVLVDTIQGYVNLNGITYYLNDFFSYEKLFGKDFPGLLPAFYLNSDMWLMVETGQLLVLNHDGTFDEVAADVFAALDKNNPAQPVTSAVFNGAFATAGSCIDITQLIQLQTEWFKLGIVNDWGADDENQEKAALEIVLRVLVCSVDELESMTNKPCLDFVYQLAYSYIEDYDGFNRPLAKVM